MPRPLPGVSRIAFSYRESAEALGVSPATVKALVAAGNLPTIRRVLIPRVALERWAEENARPALPSEWAGRWGDTPDGPRGSS